MSTDRDVFLSGPDVLIVKYRDSPCSSTQNLWTESFWSTSDQFPNHFEKYREKSISGK